MRSGMTLRQEPGNSGYQDASLAGTGSSHDQERPADRPYNLTLFLIEALQYLLCVGFQRHRYQVNSPAVKIGHLCHIAAHKMR